MSAKPNAMKYHIITMAKVASASFLTALEHAEGGCTHYHSLSRFRSCEASFKQNGGVIITGTRNPVARNISYFFQTFTDDFVNDLSEYCFVATQEEIMRMNVDVLIEKFFAQYWHGTPLNWWAAFAKLCDLKLTPQHFESGYATAPFHGATIIVYRMEDLPKRPNFSAVLPVTELPYTNDSDQRWYSDIYREFRARIEFPRSYLDALLDRPVTRSIYSDAEIAGFYRAVRVAPRWV